MKSGCKKSDSTYFGTRRLCTRVCTQIPAHLYAHAHISARAHIYKHARIRTGYEGETIAMTISRKELFSRQRPISQRHR